MLGFVFVLISFFHMFGAVVVPYFVGEDKGGGGSFKIERPRSRGCKNFGRRWTEEVGGLEN